MTKGKGCGVTNYIKTAYHITGSASIISNRNGNLPHDWSVYEVRKKKKTNNKSGQDFFIEKYPLFHHLQQLSIYHDAHKRFAQTISINLTKCLCRRDSYHLFYKAK